MTETFFITVKYACNIYCDYSLIFFNERKVINVSN